MTDAGYLKRSDLSKGNKSLSRERSKRPLVTEDQFLSKEKITRFK